ncbi:MAG: hypothetical protein PVG35_06675 [Desulfobacterales bacterium]
MVRLASVSSNGSISNCPIEAFQNSVYSARELDQSILPGIKGTYDRVTCNVKMEEDIEEAVMAIPAGDEEHQEIRLAIDEFEEGVNVEIFNISLINLIYDKFLFELLTQ